MKAYSSKVQSAKYRLEADRKEKQYQEWLASLSDEEREKHFAEKKKSAERGRKRLAQLLTLTSVLGGDYTIKGENPLEEGRYRKQCPFCKAFSEGYAGNNLFCKCNAKYYWGDKVWLNRNTGEEVWESEVSE